MEASNVKEMREALENLVRFEEADLRQLEHLANRAIDEDIYGGGILLAIVGAIREGKKALAASPPRNCDRFDTKEEAAMAFAEEKKQWIPQQVLWELAPWFDWLFATETKGATDGSK